MQHVIVDEDYRLGSLTDLSANPGFTVLFMWSWTSYFTTVGLVSASRK